MSPFDMFVLIVFLIATIKAATDAVNFWKEAEEVASIHFKATNAARNLSNSKQSSALSRRASNISPKHLPPPVRPARMPSGEDAHRVTKPRAIRTGLKSKSISKTAA